MTSNNTHIPIHTLFDFFRKHYYIDSQGGVGVSAYLYGVIQISCLSDQTFFCESPIQFILALVYIHKARHCLDFFFVTELAVRSLSSGAVQN